MMDKLATTTRSVFAVLLLALTTAPAGLAQEVSPKPMVIPPVSHDVSPPLRDMVFFAPAAAPTGQRIVPLRPTPPLPGASNQLLEDSVLQSQSLPLIGVSNALNFDGIGADGVAPPDTTGAVGDNTTNQFVQMVNEEYAVYNKITGAVILGPTPIDVIWSGFSGACSTGNGGDVDVVFDKAASRWVVSQLGPGFTSYCIAVSTSDDATGSYARYEFDFGNNIPDYPKLGVWPDAYYWTSNTFQNGANFLGAMPCAFDRATMLTGGPANAICFQENSTVASLLPSDLDGSTAPPTGEPNFYLELLSTTSLGLFKFHVDFTTPSNSTFTGPTSISVASFGEACGGFGSCIPQSGTTQQLDSLGDRLMYRLAYRNFGDHESLVVNHSVTAGSSVGVRWYEIRDPNGTPTVFQSGTFAPDSEFRWMGSIAMDQVGDIAVGYSASSSSIHPAVRHTGRVPSDPVGMLESEASIIEGTGSQTGGLARWGDYSSMSVDPADDCTFWYTTEYLKTNGSFNWSTRIGAFKFTDCSSGPDFSISVSPSSQTVKRGSSATYTVTVAALNGFNGVVTFSVSGLPANSTAQFSPTSVTGQGTSTLTVSTSKKTATGNFTLTITGTSGSLTNSTTAGLTVNAH